MDRSVCVTSHRRLGVPDDMVDVQFPTEDPGSQFLNVVRFRQMQSEVLTVNFICREKIFPDHAKWVADIETRILDWGKAIESGSISGPEWYKISVAHQLVLLHRPSPRDPRPPKTSLIKGFDAAIQVADGYLEHATSGFLKYVWHGASHGLEAALMMLYALRHCKAELKAQYGTKFILDAAHRFSSLFVSLRSII